MTYWDTSCIIKLYTEESDSASWMELVQGTGSVLLSSSLLSAELGVALAGKESRGELRRGGAVKVHTHFLSDVRAGRFQLLPIGMDVLEHAVQLASRCAQAARPTPLRTLDALHLATAVLMRCRVLATADARMMQAATLLGLKRLQPGS